MILRKCLFVMEKCTLWTLWNRAIPTQTDQRWWKSPNTVLLSIEQKATQLQVIHKDLLPLFQSLQRVPEFSLQGWHLFEALVHGQSRGQSHSHPSNYCWTPAINWVLLTLCHNTTTNLIVMWWFTSYGKVSHYVYMTVKKINFLTQLINNLNSLLKYMLTI